jgi:tetratricopeptide (TPR) repeat protein
LASDWQNYQTGNFSQAEQFYRQIVEAEPLAMRIAFATDSKLPLGIESPYQMPLGGAESALCYLAEALADQGHEVYLLNDSAPPGMSRGVRCVRGTAEAVQALQPLDALVELNIVGCAKKLRPFLVGKTATVLWAHHAADQPAAHRLYDPEHRAAYDGIAFVSEWQSRQYLQHFGISQERSAVLRNAIGPAFVGLFVDGTSVVAQKSRPAVLAYTSTPFRGLNLLLEVLPEIRRRIPETRLRVYSSMRVYQLAKVADEARYGELYRQCRETEGVDYIGAVPQPELSRELRSVAVLAYPNTFEETSCIAVLEAMAAGCRVVTSDLAALPETTAGFASLIPMFTAAGTDFRRSFVEAVVKVLEQFNQSGGCEATEHLRRQVAHVNKSCTWQVRAREWVQWLSSLRQLIRSNDSKSGLSSRPAIAASLAAAHAAEVFAKGRQNHDAGDLACAEELYRQAVHADPSHADAWGYLGSVCQARGKLSEAALCFRRSLTLAPGNATPYCCLAAVLVQQRKLDEAVASLREALLRHPQNVEVLYNLGSLLAWLQRMAEAIVCYRLALRIKPDFAQAHHSLVLALKAAGQRDGALGSSEFREAFRYHGGFVEALRELGD